MNLIIREIFHTMPDFELYQSPSVDERPTILSLLQRLRNDVIANQNVEEKEEPIVRPKRWKLRQKKRVEVEEVNPKKKKKGKKKKVETPPPPEVEEWELGPTLEEMREGAMEMYFDDVRQRAQVLLEYRQMTGVRRPTNAEFYLRQILTRQDQSAVTNSLTSVLTDAEMEKVNHLKIIQFV